MFHFFMFHVPCFKPHSIFQTRCLIINANIWSSDVKQQCLARSMLQTHHPLVSCPDHAALRSVLCGLNSVLGTRLVILLLDHRVHFSSSVAERSLECFNKTCSKTPWGPGRVSCIERCPHFRGKFSNKKAYLGHSKVSFIRSCPYF